MPPLKLDGEYYQPAFASLPPPPSSPGWRPYTGSKEFDINMASILVILVLATILAFTLHAVLRCLLRLYRHRRQDQQQQSPSPTSQPKYSKTSILDALPMLDYNSATKLAGGAECAICLCEFAEGERVRVLPACNHGFHVKCVEGWLTTKSSCPTCRTSCRPATTLPEP